MALFDLEKDPAEKNDLSQQLPERTTTLRAELDQWQRDTRAPISMKLNPEYDLSSR
ncbi:MAG: hypothetical protein AAGJ83_04880 [Planctomycetota bacterium]